MRRSPVTAVPSISGTATDATESSPASRSRPTTGPRGTRPTEAHPGPTSGRRTTPGPVTLKSRGVRRQRQPRNAGRGTPVTGDRHRSRRSTARAVIWDSSDVPAGAQRSTDTNPVEARRSVPVAGERLHHRRCASTRERQNVGPHIAPPVDAHSGVAARPGAVHPARPRRAGSGSRSRRRSRSPRTRRTSRRTTPTRATTPSTGRTSRPRDT